MKIDWESYKEGYDDGFANAMKISGHRDTLRRDSKIAILDRPKPKRKRPASKKQKLLKTMTDKKWKSYNGKKTWIQIRAQVSRSQAYKKKARRL